MSSLYPVFLEILGRPVLVIGGGAVASRRAQGLLEAGAAVTVVSPSLVSTLDALRVAGRVAWRPREFLPEDLDGAFLAVLAVGDREVAASVRAEATRRGVLLNAADDRELSDFHVPAVAGRGDVRIAVSTGGLSPRTARTVREAIEDWLEGAEGFLVDARSVGRDPPRGAGSGRVHLVGAGPGDPSLLTCRAAALLRAADVIYHDRLVSDEILASIPERAERVYVGKEPGNEDRADTAALLIESARAGKMVVRLKGGDPFVFGRGGEEMLALARAGIDFEIVPGVSALNAVPAAAGIPLTHRGTSSEIIVRSGHAASEEAGGAEAGSAPPATYVYFMAAGGIDRIVGELLAEGLPRSTPVAVIQKGTRPGERVLVADLASLEDPAGREEIETPALLVAGEVVRLRECRDWPRSGEGAAGARRAGTEGWKILKETLS